ncbi:MAG: PQQ-binding-like beta-propeller repeat protein [Acidobacteria bacterium]|nr:PQQ-binding-like beta-propeller repeat protein [Acidobacteriota bacterium]
MQEIDAKEFDAKSKNELLPVHRQPLRLWPGVVIAIVLGLVRYGVPLVAPNAEISSFPLAFLAILGGLLGALAIFVWWMFFSRAPWLERVGAFVLMIVALLITRFVVHESIAGAGMGMLLYLSAIPGLSLALVAWAVATPRFSDSVRRVSLVAAILLACVPWVLLRTAGIMGAGSEYHWRWTPTPEQRLLAQANDEPKPLPAATPEPPKESAAATPDGKLPSASATPAASTTPLVTPTPTVPSAEWPGFRGRNRDSVIRGVKIKTDWAASPPVELWRRPIGPGWSSFAVRGDLLYTQEQRGDDEIVGCYKLSTGEPVWRHRDAVRFWESNGGAGPRATPTLDKNRVYAFGATGILNALDASNGKLVWTRNVATDTDRKVPDWGFASSPLVIDDLVVVAAAGTLAAYNLADGKPRWKGPSYGGSYSSPHRATIDGVTQIVLLGGPGAISVAPASGAVLWEHKWESGAIAQPALLANGDIVVNALATSGGLGTRRLGVKQSAGTWTLEERWTSNGLKPYFNDFVTHKGHAYGFDGNILACISLEDGKRKWKGGRYGNGQLVLLADQDLLLVLSEEGELVLVSATTEQFKELARFPALESKTWNHPVLVGDVLLARNGEQMAAFRLPVAGR